MCPFPSMAAQVNYELDYQRLGSHYGRPGPHNPAYAQVQVLILLIRHFTLTILHLLTVYN